MTVQLAKLQSTHFHLPLWLTVVLMSLALSLPIFLTGTSFLKNLDDYDAMGLDRQALDTASSLK